MASVRPRTPAARAGLTAGDRILAVNGAELRDAIDFHFHGGGERLRLEIDRDGRRARAALVRCGPDLGIELEPPRAGDIATCRNKCVFCFIHQLPRGMRKSLYVKDDDFRLSFLHGNYITLTDLDEAELARIEAQRLSPLFVSVHATDPELRHRLLGEPRVKGDLMGRLARLARARITMHAQIVLCPGWNDGAHLHRSVHDLAPLFPHVSTVAVVPVGLTRHRERLPALRLVTSEEARALIEAIHGWQRDFLSRLGSRFVFGGDELYLIGGEPIPSAAAYEEFAIVEDGVGLVRRFEDGAVRAIRQAPRALRRPRRVTLVTGEMFGPRMQALVARIPTAGLGVDVVPVANEWFGRSIQVAGLLTARDIQAQLAGRDLGDEVLVPQVAVREGDGVFLDDLTPDDVANTIGVPVRVVEPAPAAWLRALLTSAGRS